MMPTIEVKEAEGKWGLFINDSLFATSKHRFDADFAKQVLLKAFGREEKPEMCDLCERPSDANEHNPEHADFQHPFNGPLA